MQQPMLQLPTRLLRAALWARGEPPPGPGETPRAMNAEARLLRGLPSAARPTSPISPPLATTLTRFFLLATRQSLAMVTRLARRMEHEGTWDQSAWNQEQFLPAYGSHKVTRRDTCLVCAW